MVRIMKTVQVPVVTAEQKHFFCNRVNLVQIQIEHEDVVLETMNLRCEPVMHHGTLVEAGVHAKSLSPVSVRHRSSADVKASS